MKNHTNQCRVLRTQGACDCESYTLDQLQAAYKKGYLDGARATMHGTPPDGTIGVADAERYNQRGCYPQTEAGIQHDGL